MREIKFRAWDGARNAWLHQAKTPDMAVHLAGETIMMGELWRRRDDTFVLVEEMNQVHWMQFTGLTDKNGKEIYEGDILNGGGVVRFGYYDEGEYEMNASGYGWYVGHGQPPDDAGYPISWRDGDAEQRQEVIGNIHENPELVTNG